MEMSVIAGIDIGNSTTEVALAEVSGGKVSFLSSALVETTGLKGTVANVRGVRLALSEALGKAGFGRDDFRRVAGIRLNEAAPVIGDVAMETVSETIITESTMIGHNPSTPGGVGIGSGITVAFGDLRKAVPGEDTIVLVPSDFDYEEVASGITRACERGVSVKAVVCQGDDGVLVANRLKEPLPVVDEVRAIEKVPLSMPACVEVAPPGRIIEFLSNPYDVATIFGLSPEETKQIVPVTRALVGNRSAVIVRTPLGEVKERRIPAGTIYVDGPTGRREVGVDDGADAIMDVVKVSMPVRDIFGEPGTNVGGMMERVRRTMSELTGLSVGEVHIRDLLAADTVVPHKVVGGLAGEFSNESGVALAVMVETDRLPMKKLAEAIEADLGIKAEIGGVEAEMAVHGALTTPGTKKPLAILDLGAGSTDASLLKGDDSVELIHLAGAGNMVNSMIASELGFTDMELAENIKRYPLCKVESAFHIRQEDGTVRFFESALPPEIFGRVALILDNDQIVPIPVRAPLERIRQVRRKAKREVFVTNSLRALKRVAPAGNVRLIDYVVLVGGSALDFEVPGMVTEELSKFGVVAGRGNIRGSEGPRNAVATGLALSVAEGWK